jgi:hypothetical protein
MLTLFRPATGELRAKGVLSAPNAVLHPWLKGELTDVLAEIEKKHPRGAQRDHDREGTGMGPFRLVLDLGKSMMV